MAASPFPLEALIPSSLATRWIVPLLMVITMLSRPSYDWVMVRSPPWLADKTQLLTDSSGPGHRFPQIHTDFGLAPGIQSVEICANLCPQRFASQSAIIPSFCLTTWTMSHFPCLLAMNHSLRSGRRTVVQVERQELAYYVRLAIQSLAFFFFVVADRWTALTRNRSRCIIQLH
jgi:hypothetical protein